VRAGSADPDEVPLAAARMAVGYRRARVRPHTGNAAVTVRPAAATGRRSASQAGSRVGV
jgi:hypothetical protein